MVKPSDGLGGRERLVPPRRLRRPGGCRGRWPIAVLCLLLLGSWAGPARAADRESLSSYERETLDQELAARGAAVEPRPQGLHIEAIDVAVLDVIEARDPAPGFLNWLHSSSRQAVIERELLFRTGQPYEQALVDETARNLRALRQLSVVLIAAVKGSRAGTVRVLVIVKDVWSLRLNSGYTVQGGKLLYLFLQPAEENLLGTHRRVAASFLYEPDTVSVGGRLFEPRLASSRVQALLDGNVIINHATGALEGSFGALQYGQPLYSTRQRWSWGAVASWRHEISRRFVDGELERYDATATDAVDAIPVVYDSDLINGRFSFTRSFGLGLKHDLRFGVGVDRRAHSAPDLGGYDPAAAAEMVAARLPRSDTRNGPFVEYHLHHTDFATLLDVETLALQESYRLGPELYLRFYPVARFLGSTRDFLGYHAEVAYTLAPRDALVRAYAAGTIEARPDGRAVDDSLLQVGLRAVSPRFYVGRLVYDATFLYRPHNLLNDLETIGGDGRLRGYRSGQLIGRDAFAANLELRSRALKLWTVLLGGALFYDVADAFDGLDDLAPKQGAGFGLRVLFPQLQRLVMRVDWGFPLTAGTGPHGVFDGLVLTFGQAFELPRPTGEGILLFEQ